MADLGMDLDHESVERSTFEPLPAGTYFAQVKASDVVTTNSGDGKMIKLQWEILSGPFEGRIVFQQINYQNPSAKAQLIGQQQVKAICEAIGHAGPLRNTDVLEFKPVNIRLNIKRSEQYGDQNEVKDVKAHDAGRPPGGGASTARTTGNRATAATTNTPPPQQRAPAGSGGAAWRK